MNNSYPSYGPNGTTIWTISNKTGSIGPAFLTMAVQTPPPNRYMPHELIMLFLHYVIAFPIFLLCSFALIGYLRKRGHISSSDADSMINELREIRIPGPRAS